MRSNLASIALGGALAIIAGATLAQPMMGPGGGYMHGPGAGMMGRGWGYSDPAGYLGDLKLVATELVVALRALSFAGPARLVRPALVNGAPGVVVTVRGRPVSVMGFTVTDGHIAAIDVLTDPDRLSRLDLTVLDA